MKALVELVVLLLVAGLTGTLVGELYRLACAIYIHMT